MPELVVQNNSVFCRCPFQTWMDIMSNAFSVSQVAVKLVPTILYYLSYMFRKWKKKKKVVVVRQEVVVDRKEVIVDLVAF